MKSKKGQAELGALVFRYKFTLLGCIAGGMIGGSINSILVLGFIGFIIDNISP